MLSRPAARPRNPTTETGLLPVRKEPNAPRTANSAPSAGGGRPGPAGAEPNGNHTDSGGPSRALRTTHAGGHLSPCTPLSRFCPKSPQIPRPNPLTPTDPSGIFTMGCFETSDPEVVPTSWPTSGPILVANDTGTRRTPGGAWVTSRKRNPLVPGLRPEPCAARRSEHGNVFCHDPAPGSWPRGLDVPHRLHLRAGEGPVQRDRARIVVVDAKEWLTPGTRYGVSSH